VARIARNPKTIEIAVCLPAHVTPRDVPVHSQEMGVPDNVCGMQRAMKQAISGSLGGIEEIGRGEHLRIVVAVVSGDAEPTRDFRFEGRVYSIGSRLVRVEKTTAERRAIGRLDEREAHDVAKVVVKKGGR